MGYPRLKYTHDVAQQPFLVFVLFLRCLSHSDIHIEAFEGERTCFKVSFDGASFFNGPGLDHIALSFYATIGKVFQFSPVTSLSMEFDDPDPTVDEWLFLLSNFPR